MLKAAAIKLICFYQANVRSLFLPACRFVPSCSEYAKEAILKFGILKGGFMAAKRILRCHPLNKKHGWDPVE